MRVLHVINCLSLGGAERQLLRLAAAQRQAGDEVQVVTLLAKDTLRAEAEAQGIVVRALGMRSPLGLPRTITRLRRAFSLFQPDVIQSWLYYANVLAAIANGRPRSGRTPLAWNLRQTLPDISREHFLMRRAIRVGARLSSTADAIVYNAESGREQHHAIGYRSANETVIPNAFVVDPAGASIESRAAARAVSRRLLDLPHSAPVIGHAARFHPMKDHAGFLMAMALLLAQRRDLVVVLAGREVNTVQFSALLDESTEHGAILVRALESNRLRFIGERLDLGALLPAFDVLVSSSAWGEAFPNVVAEAMAAGVAVVATDVGDSATIVGDTGRIVAPGRSDELSAAVAVLLDMPPAQRLQLGAAARLRVAERYSVETVLSRYRELWAGLVGPRS